jgi:hypothetical protein
MTNPEVQERIRRGGYRSVMGGDRFPTIALVTFDAAKVEP